MAACGVERGGNDPGRGGGYLVWGGESKLEWGFLKWGMSGGKAGVHDE